MPLRLSYAPKAVQDLNRLLVYLAAASDPFTARRFVDQMRARCSGLITAPGMGSPYSRRLGIRKVNEGPYKIFYRVTPAEVIILRIWDGRRSGRPRVDPS
jgi:plasmid stabilization system protein ParE